MLVAGFGGLLGILMMIPLRRAFIVKQHGTLTYPEGTACAKVLIVGEQGGASAQTVFAGFGLAFVYQVLMEAMKLWQQYPEKAIERFTAAVVTLEASPVLLGVGYIIGFRTSCVMVGGRYAGGAGPGAGDRALRRQCRRTDLPRDEADQGDDARGDPASVRALHRRRGGRHGGCHQPAPGACR